MKQNNKNIICTVSAGYSSAIMAIHIKKWYPDHNIEFVFANTGKEHLKSLKFLRDLDLMYDLNIKYLQAEIIKTRGKGTELRVLEFKDLDTKGYIFESGIEKYGIPNVANPWCTRELKNSVVKKFADNTFGKNNYSIALGIRTDEIDRVSKNYKTNNIFYPLIEKEISIKQRNLFFKDHKLKLEVPAYMGNCQLCYKKSNRKNMTHLLEEPYIAEWYKDMEALYSDVLIPGKKQYNSLIERYGGSYFFRKNMSIYELVELAKKPFNKATDEYIYQNDLMDQEEDCGIGCVIFN